MDNVENVVKKQQNNQSFSRFAKTYSDHAAVQAHVFKYLVQLLKKEGLETAESLLDFGCGPGNHSEALIQAFQLKKLVGMDISPAMIEEAKKAAPAGVFLTAEELAASTQDFDAIVASSVFQWVEDWETSCLDIVGRLKAGGFFAASIFGPQTYHELAHSLSVVMGSPQHLTASAFKPVEEMLAILKPHMSIGHASSSFIKKSYPNLMALLKTIQFTGTGGLGLQAKRLWTPRFFKAVEAAYIALYGGIYASHHVYFVVAKKQ
jgi:malonyl-ACP O-methyltransferase BioC